MAAGGWIITTRLDPSPADIAIVFDGLREFTDAASPRPANRIEFAMHLADPATGAAIGGLTGYALFDWMFIQYLYVPAALRGEGHGARLMAEAEAFARQHDLAGIWLDTFSFQARPFYEKLGFAVFGSIANHPRGAERFFMSKRL